MSFWECEKCGGILGVTGCCSDLKSKEQAMTKQVELPQPAHYYYIGQIDGKEKYFPTFTADQMRQYADDCVKAEIKRIVEKFFEENPPFLK